MSRQNDIKRLITEHNRQLQRLKEKQAQYGPLQTPVHILTEIEDIEREIEKLQQKLKILEKDNENLVKKHVIAEPELKRIFSWRTVFLGGLLIGIVLFAVSPTEKANKVSNCRVTVEKIMIERDLIGPNQSMSVVIDVKNPDNLALLFNWQAIYGKMNPGLRTSSIQSAYTAPPTLVDDTISVEVSAPGCLPLQLSKQVKVISLSGDRLNSSDVISTTSTTFEFEGIWKGGTTQGGKVYFVVKGGKVTNLTIEYPVYSVSGATSCPISGEIFGGEAIIDSNLFTYATMYSSDPFEVKGEFKSSKFAIGTFRPLEEQPSVWGKNECGVFPTDWEAKKQ